MGDIPPYAEVPNTRVAIKIFGEKVKVGFE